MIHMTSTILLIMFMFMPAAAHIRQVTIGLWSTVSENNNLKIDNISINPKLINRVHLLFTSRRTKFTEYHRLMNESLRTSAFTFCTAFSISALTEKSKDSWRDFVNIGLLSFWKSDTSSVSGGLLCISIRFEPIFERHSKHDTINNCSYYSTLKCLRGTFNNNFGTNTRNLTRPRTFF